VFYGPFSADLKHFKEITQGGVVVMGRKTLESMGRALPNRVNFAFTNTVVFVHCHNVDNFYILPCHNLIL
jgi:dihydrofolate reductase